MLRDLLVRAVALAVAVAMTSAVTVPAPAGADRGYPRPAALFDRTPTSGQPVAAMAGDGTLVVGRDEPDDGGGLQVQVRRPGRDWGAPEILQEAAAGVDPWGLRLVGGPGGDLAAVWNAGGGLGHRAALRPAGASGWTAPREVGVRPAVGGLALDPRGRLWVAGQVDDATRVQVIDGGGVRRTVRLPDPRAGARDVRHRLAIGADGAVRLAYVSERTVTTTVDGSTECDYRGDLLVADLAPGPPRPRPRRLSRREGTGEGGSGACFLDDGASFGRLALVIGTDGVATLLTEVVRHDSDTTSVTARRAVAGGAWPTGGPTVVPAARQSLLGAAAVGSRVLALLSHTTTGTGSTAALRLATGSPTGDWSAPRLLHGGGTTAAGIAGSAGGGLIAWRDLDPPYALHLRVVSGRGALARSLTLDGAATLIPGDVVVDERGDGGVAFLPVDDDVARFQPYDGAGPRVTRLAVPARARRGDVVRLRAAAVDTWSRVRSYRWRIGDARRAGPVVRVRLRRTGRVPVVLTVTDRRGTATRLTRTIRVRPGR